MIFCRSRMLRKKSLDISAAGLIVRAGAMGGPEMEYEGVAVGGGGCRLRYAGTSRKKSVETRGIRGKRYGLRHTNVYTMRKERVCDGVLHVNSRMMRFWKTNATPTLLFTVSGRKRGKSWRREYT